jgi:hypothetical protein
VSRRQALAQLAAMVGVGVGLPAAIGRRLPRPRGADDVETELDFNPAEERRNLVKEPLGWVLIGNSMLNSRLYTPHLNKVSGWHSRKLAVGGTQSAIWWLFFKNILIASGARPHWVTIFFRESDLTWPDFRISGKNAELIRRLQTPQEPEWDQVMAGRSPLVSHSSSVVEAVFGLEDHDDWARRRVQDGAFELTALEGVKRGPRRMELNELFSLDRLRGDLGDDGGDGGDGPPPPALGTDENTPEVKLPDPGMYAQAPTVFDASPSASFLPHFVALAARHDIRLHFHRVKRRPDEAGRRPDLPIFRRYLDDLQDYLRSQGCAYSDESAIPDQTLAWYQDGDHLNKARREAFAGTFWTLVRDQIGPPPPGGGRRPQAAG